MKEKDIITIEELKVTPYGDLKEKLEAMGVGHVWKHAKKKADLLKEGIEAYKAIVFASKPELDIKEKQMPKAPINKTEVKKPWIKEIPKYSLEVIEKNLINIDANLRNNVQTQRNALLKKKKELTDMKKLYEK
jgi:hypothetical protein